jgi:hypothetical protein
MYLRGHWAVLSQSFFISILLNPEFTDILKGHYENYVFITKLEELVFCLKKFS